TNNLDGDPLQVVKIYCNVNFIKTVSGHIHLDFPIVTMNIFTFAFISPELMRRGKTRFYHQFIHEKPPKTLYSTAFYVLRSKHYCNIFHSVNAITQYAERC